MDSFRKAYGALKDTTTVSLAKVNSEFKDLDIAIVKATNHVECPPKERHVRKIFAVTSVSCPRADVAYCIHALSRRLAKTGSWIVALKTLIVIHRTLREGDPTFKEEFLYYSRRGHLFQISKFKDDSSPHAWDCSAWVRTYALFLEERLECFRTLKYDIESEQLIKTASGISKIRSRTRILNAEQLLEMLPSLQQLLYRLVSCQPQGAACYNYLIQYALALVLKESFKIYCAINDGIINLVDMYFDMAKHDAVKALNIYKTAAKQAEQLADFYEFCRTLDLSRTFQFPILRQAPPSFLATMEEYVREAPQTGAMSIKRLEYEEYPKPEEETQKPEASTPEESEKLVAEVESEEEQVDAQEEPQTGNEEEIGPQISAEEPVDLLGLNEVNPKALELEESNALALAIVQPGDEGLPMHNAWSEIGKTSGWELALVTAPSNNKSQVAETNMEYEEYPKPEEETQKPEASTPEESEKLVAEVESEEEQVDAQEEPQTGNEEEIGPQISAEEPVDLLGLNEVNPKALELEESNALALAIVQPGDEGLPMHNAWSEIGKTSGWELALVTAPSNNKSQVADTKMAGGFDKLLLDSLYEDDSARRQLKLQNAGYKASYGHEMAVPNPFDQPDPFTMSNNFAPPINVQMAHMSQQQQMMMQQQQQQNMMVSYQHKTQYSHSQMAQMGSSNPFGDPFVYPQSAMPPQGNHTLL
ncbi:clathrin assembly At5g57200 [Olea europaea subsp. europaea]|uniref:Clathrin assembly At5g57200 n=1 Tax=Olea europaea subsp. europaea TaxID=158383 RepID=A0A8S0UTN2_OLEEU|nr:clathrin assembly At5g57200 [Olea europaea subsp. europaea]